MSKVIGSFSEVSESSLHQMNIVYKGLPKSYWYGKSAYNHRFDNFRCMIDRKGASKKYCQDELEGLTEKGFRNTSKMALYFGVPWCIQSCSFCDLAFSRKPNVDEKRNYIQQILKEVEIRNNDSFQRKSVASAYFGGGTPSILDTEMLCDYIDQALKPFDMAGNAVVTLEASPATLNSNKLEAMQSRVSRISLGVQSTDTELRQREGRILSREKLLPQLALTLGYFSLVNVDVLYGMKGQSFESIYLTLSDLIELEVPSITYYRMELFPGTKSYDQAKRAPWYGVNEVDIRRMYFFGKYMLESAGYVESPLGWFIKSNRSNTTVPWSRMVESWGNVLPYLGFGVGAFSTSASHWMQNVETTKGWSSRVDAGQFATDRCYPLDEMEGFIVKLMRHIRAFKKIKYSFLDEQTSLDLSRIKKFFDLSISQGLFVNKNDYIELTKSGESLVHWVLDDLAKAALSTLVESNAELLDVAQVD